MAPVAVMVELVFRVYVPLNPYTLAKLPQHVHLLCCQHCLCGTQIYTPDLRGWGTLIGMHWPLCHGQRAYDPLAG